jgi:hypothetical protein
MHDDLDIFRRVVLHLGDLDLALVIGGDEWNRSLEEVVVAKGISVMIRVLRVRCSITARTRILPPRSPRL